MLFSIVMPTHNRLHLLRDAIETVRRQESGEWELVVFDNASDDPIGQHVQSLNDARVRYARSDEFLPVTSSWNRAMDLARGDYVLLLGDDDGLTPNYFGRLEKIIEKFGRPDVVYSNIYQFWHRGVAPWEPAAHVIDVRHGFFFENRSQPFLLSERDAHHAAQGSIRLQINFSFNSQAIVYKREFLARLSSDGPIYRSPFPDYYIANVALARSASTVVIPEPLAVAGVSKASFGFTMYNDAEERGNALLNTKLHQDPVYLEVKDRLLEGPAYNTNLVIAMEYVARALPELREAVDFGRYRRLQIYAAISSSSDALWRTIRGRLSFGERVFAAIAWRVLRLSRHSHLAKRFLLPPVERYVATVGSNPMVRHCGQHDLEKVTDLYDALARGSLS